MRKSEGIISAKDSACEGERFSVFSSELLVGNSYRPSVSKNSKPKTEN